ncbi:hypothetical protein MSG28_008672 [Choristoneura fumiferana]|uniref:Uncharacterized protein n=1 Tax=Choristoneura fumiferana TaxID=7141 RepID=A0ACC0J7K6_CHOFU|nr:hypothetical protein MSG28_008672 [Choristoneura fumiferana]
MARWLVIAIGLLGLCWPIGCGDSKYDNYTLMRIVPHNTQHLEELARLHDDPEGVEILKRSHGLNDTTDVLVSPNKSVFLEELVAKSGMPVQYKYNYGRLGKRIVSISTQLTKITNYINELGTRAPDMVTVQNVGQSYNGRKMQLVKISTNPRGRNPVIFIDAGIHAREWVAPAMAMYLIHRLTNDPKARQRELNGVDWYILPNRLWRKTRSKSSPNNCFGVDGNRNYGFKWGVSGVSNNPCDPETYAGSQPFSEVETQIVRNIMMENQQRLKLYVSLHSYGQYLVYPWGYTADVLPRDWKKLHNLARMVSDSVVRAGGRPFNVMSAGQWYPAAGGSDDFAFGVVGVPYSYTMELTDGYEFTFPDKLLRVVLPQFYDGFITFSAQIKREFGQS